MITHLTHRYIFVRLSIVYFLFMANTLTHTQYTPMQSIVYSFNSYSKWLFLFVFFFCFISNPTKWHGKSCTHSRKSTHYTTANTNATLSTLSRNKRTAWPKLDDNNIIPMRLCREKHRHDTIYCNIATVRNKNWKASLDISTSAYYICVYILNDIVNL